MRLLLSSDLHIGRSSTRVPDSVRSDEIRADRAWSRMVDLALSEQVDVVCLGGDVADQDNKFWEAIGPLQQGIGRLAHAKIRTVAVAGNHDHDVLVRLADQLPPEHFALVGRGGRWQRLTIDDAQGRPVLHIDGWSFPTQRMHQSPLDSYDLAPDPTVPILGIVHGDLDNAATPYGPLDRARLQALPPAAWLLGHLHGPRLIDGPPWLLYPGSPQALDPGEPGPHGPWLVEVDRGTLATPRQRAISSVWYDRIRINLDGAADEMDLEATLLNSVRQQADRIAACAGSDLAHASLRLELVGSTPVAHLVTQVARSAIDGLSLPVGTGQLGIEAVDNQAMPVMDLTEYAPTHTAPGTVARLLVELESDQVSNEVAQLLRQVRSELNQVEKQREFASLPRRQVTDEMIRQHLRKQGRALLSQLVGANR